MKKSEIYRLAQEAVVLVPCFKTSEKLEVLRELIAQEDLALFVEEKESQNEAV